MGLWEIHAMKYYSAKKRKEVLTHNNVGESQVQTQKVMIHVHNIPEKIDYIVTETDQ